MLILLRIIYCGNFTAAVSNLRWSMRRQNCSKGFIVISFGVGLFLAYCFPTKILVIALAILLIAAGFFLLKS